MKRRGDRVVILSVGSPYHGMYGTIVKDHRSFRARYGVKMDDGTIIRASILKKVSKDEGRQAA